MRAMNHVSGSGTRTIAGIDIAIAIIVAMIGNVLLAIFLVLLAITALLFDISRGLHR